jgi:hypothetical protein
MNPVTDAIDNAGPVQTEAVATPATKQANAKGKDKKPSKPGKTTKPAAKGTKSAKNAKPAKKAANAKQAKATKKAAAPAKKAAKTGERSNKKAEVIAMMERAKGATLAEIMEATGWQRHTVRGVRENSGSRFLRVADNPLGAFARESMLMALLVVRGARRRESGAN